MLPRSVSKGSPNPASAARKFTKINQTATRDLARRQKLSSARLPPLLTYIEQQCIRLLGMDMGKDLVAASATPLVLAILAEGDSYGYAIIKRVRKLSNGHLLWTDGMLYPVLHRLEREGLVVSKWVSPSSGRRR